MIGYVLQEEVSVIQKSFYGSVFDDPKNYPRTIIVPKENFSELMARSSRRVLFEKSKRAALDSYTSAEGREEKRKLMWGLVDAKNGILQTEFVHSSSISLETWGLELPPALAYHYRLVEGDEVGINILSKKGIVFISSVNGCQDPIIFQSWEPDLSERQSDYPKRPLPVEKYGDFDLRTITLLAPIGLGSSYWLIAPGGSGKTWILVKIFDACLKLTREINNLYVIMGYVGDRPEDAAQYLEVLSRFRGVRGELHQASWNTPPDAQVDITKFVMNRARRLTAIGMHVVVLFDSTSRTVAAHTASSYVDKDSGMISGGLYRDSLTQMVALQFGTHGSYGNDRSLTIIGTVLSSDSNKKTSESVVDQETADSSTTAICRLVKIPTLGRPWISVNEAETYTRFPEGRDFRNVEQKREMEHVKFLMRGEEGKSNSYKAHEALLKYVANHRIPSYCN